MKIKAIVSRCKRTKTFLLFDGIMKETGETFAEQWLGSGAALYPLEGVPRMGKDDIYTIFDIPEKQREKIYFREEATLPAGYDFNDAVKGERLCAELEPWIVLNGTGTVIPYSTSDGITFIARELLEPFDDMQDEIELYERRTASGKLYFAAKNGMLLVGILFPMDVINGCFVEQLRRLTQRCESALATKNAAEETATQASLFDTATEASEPENKQDDPESEDNDPA